MEKATEENLNKFLVDARGFVNHGAIPEIARKLAATFERIEMLNGSVQDLRNSIHEVGESSSALSKQLNTLTNKIFWVYVGMGIVMFLQFLFHVCEGK